MTERNIPGKRRVPQFITAGICTKSSRNSIRGIEIFRAATWKIVAEIDGPGDLRVGYEPVASVNVEIKRDKRYKFGGPGVVKSIRVRFREDLQGLTIEETRAYLLKADLKNRLEYWRKERERLSAELDKAAEKIADLTSISIEEADV